MSLTTSPSSPHEETAHNLSKAVSELQRTLQSFQTDIEKGIQNLVITPPDAPTQNPHEPTILTLLPAPPETTSHLSKLSQKLQSMEQTLRAHSQWHPPLPRSPSPLPLLSLADLDSAIDLLEKILAHMHPHHQHHQRTPRPFFSPHPWSWDPLWKEFYTYIPDRHMYVYLSTWKLNRHRGVWEHQSMAHRAGLGPQVAVEELGSWEDWVWDPVWGEWCLDVSSNSNSNSGGGGGEGGERCCVYASRWRVEPDGEWVYDGRFGGVGEE